MKVNIAGGEAEFNRWGWRSLLESRGLDIAQPEVCALGGISEYLRVLALCHAHFTPVINHVWGSAVAVVTNLHLLAAIREWVSSSGLTQIEAAAAMGVKQPTLNDAIKGRYHKFTIDRLVRMLSEVGKQVNITVSDKAA